MSRPLRIMCLSNMYPGPADPDYGAFVATMCTALEADGHDVRRVVIDHRRAGRLRTPLKYLGLLARALRAARGVDVIYAHYIAPTGVIAAVVGTIFRRPWVITAHGGDVRNLRSPRVRRLSQRALRRAGGVIAVSRFLAEDIATVGGVTGPIDVINMGVDTTRFRPRDRAEARRECGIPADAAVVLAVGGVTERKNPLRLLEAVAPLMDERPDLRLVYVGHGPLEGALQAAIAKRGLDDRVIRTGAVDGATVARWMTACDLLALPSTVEPLGIVALEAMASGRPVVATRVGGTAEILGDAGVLVDPGDVADIRRGVVSMLDAPPDAAVCVRQATRFDVTTQAERVTEVLRRAVRPPSPATRDTPPTQ